jgi:cyclophilin family peptidyl-prolyl cis-trans isomerase
MLSRELSALPCPGSRTPVVLTGSERRKIRRQMGIQMAFRPAAAVIAAGLISAGAVHQDRASLLLKPTAPEFLARAPERVIVRLETSIGRIDIEVLRSWAPRGADRFVALARHGYYDGNRFFRVRPKRWVQFGINGNPAIAQAWRHQTFPDDPFTQSNTPGTVAFAFAVPNGRATQVFVNTTDNSATHDKEPFTPFGRVVSGMNYVDAVNAEYGEGPGGIRAGKQDAFFAGGHEWLLARFPKLDYIERVTLLER